MCDSDSVSYNRSLRDGAKDASKREKAAEADSPAPKGEWGDDGSWVLDGLPPERDC